MVKMFFSGSEDPAIVMVSFLTKCTGIWMHKNRAELCCRYFVMIYTCYHLCFGITMQTIASINCRHNVTELIYTIFLTVDTCLSLFKMIIMFLHRQEFFELVTHLREKFLHSDYDTQEQELLNKCKRLSAIGIGTMTVFTYATVLSFMVTPLIDNIGKNESDRQLPFAIPVTNLPLSLSPYYELALLMQTLMLHQIAVSFTSFDFFLCVINMHVTTQFRILQHRLSHLNYTNRKGSSDGKIEKPPADASEACYAAFRANIQYHQTLISFCAKIEEVYSPIVLGEMLSNSVVLTLLGIQLLGGASENGGIFTFVSHLTTNFIQLFLFTYTCDGLIQESLNVAEAIFNAPWYLLLMNKYGKMLRRDLAFVILKCRVPCCITAKGFFPISLETYTKVWTSTFSYFTLLREAMD